MTTQENYDDRIALLQGTLDLLILKTLVMGPCHGQGIARLIQRQSEEVFFCRPWVTLSGTAAAGGEEVDPRQVGPERKQS
jgi:hypothetical protein